MNKNINTFNKWALLNKDESMASGHYPSVQYMINLVQEQTTIFNSSFSFIDLGCGNGWVIRELLKNKHCIEAIGIDGSKNMINKAIQQKLGKFILADIESFNFNKKYDVIFSMETFYYLKEPKKILENIYLNGIREDGMIIIGIDHFKENILSLTWGKDYNLDLTTLTIQEWIQLFKANGFKKVNHKINKYKEQNKTLIIYGFK